MTVKASVSAGDIADGATLACDGFVRRFVDAISMLQYAV